MAKTAVSSWDTTASNNTDVGGIGIQGTNAVSNFDNAMREIMAQIASYIGTPALAQTNLSVDGKVVYASKSSGYTAVATDNNAIHRFTASATLSLTAAATLGSGWHYFVRADGGDVTVDPNGTETIDGASTIVIPDGSSTLIWCDGTGFRTDRGYAVSYAVVTPWVSYTPTFTGFGTVSSVSVWSRRVGDTLHIRGRFTSGTPTAVEARMTLGFNGVDGAVTASATKVPTTQMAGGMTEDTAAATSIYTIVTGGLGYINFGRQDASNGGLIAATGSNLSSLNRVFSFTAEVPISGW